VRRTKEGYKREKLEGWKVVQDMSSEQFSESEIEIVKGEDESWIDIVADYFRQVHLSSA
jgi:hypothetical protein